MSCKSLLAAFAVLAVPSLAIAATGEREARVEWKVGGSADASARTAAPSPAHIVARGSPTVNASQKELQVVAQAAKAKASKNAGGKPSEQPGSKSSGGSGSLAKPSAEMKVVAAAMKAKAAKNAGGKPSEQPKAGGSTGDAPTGTGNAEAKVVASAMKAKAEKNASGKPSEQPRSHAAPAGGFARSSASGGRAAGFGGRLGGVEARAPFGHGMSPGERATHCNARGMCF